MQISEFIEATSRIENYYAKEYTTEQRQIMFEELKEMSLERYKQLISSALRTSKFLPKIADFIELNNTITYKTTVDSEQEECSRCDGTGYVPYKKKIKDGDKELIYTFASRCTCKNAIGLYDKIPTFQEVGIS